ncbi:MAG: NAD(P)H-dependent oxidoreductase subunit E, partial [Acidovorax sp.]|nr:NAD(P)H-dependent oxidoreductase subunit E [Acidovorax sp.]
MTLSTPPSATFLATADDMRERIRCKSHLKGRQPEDVAMTEVAGLLGPRPATGLRRDLLIEYLHRLNDHFGVLHDRHLVALAKQMNLPMAEVYEVASFYHHFEIVRGHDAQAPRLVVRVCDSLSCSLAGARELLAALPARLQAAGQGDVQVQAVPCVGRCEQA